MIVGLASNETFLQNVYELPHRTEASVLQLLSSDPVHTGCQMRRINVDERLSSGERSNYERGQPQRPFGIRLTKRTVRAVLVTVRQLPLVT